MAAGAECPLYTPQTLSRQRGAPPPRAVACHCWRQRRASPALPAYPEPILRPAVVASAFLYSGLATLHSQPAAQARGPGRLDPPTQRLAHKGHDVSRGPRLVPIFPWVTAPPTPNAAPYVQVTGCVTRFAR